MKLELLAPCHDMATLKAAVSAGADAVYLGITKYNMRVNARNFTLKEIPKAVKYCHENKVKIYVTVNVVIYENELKTIKELLTKLKKMNVDAVIVHDLGVLKLANNLGLECHISTQANITNSESVNEYAKLGAKRVILSRELTLNQIKKIIKKSKIPVEAFIHGAMCVSISGRCFFSQAMYLKNANRGECMQPCRQQWTVKNQDGDFIYDGKQFLNAKDLCMIEHIPKLIKAGIKSFKIEGRMKDANYVSTVVKCYREAIDHYEKKKIPYWKKELTSVFNRGYSTGFYFNRPDNEVNLELTGNTSITRKELIGKVIKYYNKAGVAEVKLHSGSLKINDEIIIENSNDYLKQEVESIEINKKKISKAIKGQSIGLKVNKPVKTGSKIYKLKITK